MQWKAISSLIQDPAGEKCLCTRQWWTHEGQKTPNSKTARRRTPGIGQKLHGRVSPEGISLCVQTSCRAPDTEEPMGPGSHITALGQRVYIVYSESRLGDGRHVVTEVMLRRASCWIHLPPPASLCGEVIEMQPDIFQNNDARPHQRNGGSDQSPQFERS